MPSPAPTGRILLRALAPAFMAMMLLPGAAANAAVAPQYERLRQLHAVMSVISDAGRLLGPAAIDRIETVDDGRTFRIWAGGCNVAVTLDAASDADSSAQAPRAGAPTQYRATIGPRTCR